jgi:AraC-like DNA-binding protein
MKAEQFSPENVLILNNESLAAVRHTARWRQSHALCYVLGGSKHIAGIEGPLQLHEGAAIFIQKGACLTEYPQDDGPVSLLTFLIPDHYIIAFVNEYLAGEQPAWSAQKSIISITYDEGVEHLCRSVANLLASEQPAPEALLDLRFRELLLSMVLNNDNRPLRNTLLSVHRSAGTSLHTILEENFARNLTLKDYAKLTNRSVSSFKRDFFAIYQTSPGRWLLEKKLARAKCLLMQHTMPVADVAFESGFENTAHFSRLFRQKTGYSPIEFRRKYRRKAVVEV